MEGGSTPRPAKRDVPWMVILLGALAVYAALLVILNDKKVGISFVLFTAQISLVVLIVLCLGLGFVGGFLFDRWRARRRS